jgi:hypothetical protein
VSVTDEKVAPVSTSASRSLLAQYHISTSKPRGDAPDAFGKRRVEVDHLGADREAVAAHPTTFVSSSE